MSLTSKNAQKSQALYRFFGTDGELLYIGITNDPGARWRAHSGDKPWWTEVAHTTIEHFASRKEVEAAEVIAIKAEHPKYNVEHNGSRSGRQKWAPPNEEVAALIDEIVENYVRSQQHDATYKELLAKATTKPGPDVPIAHIAERLTIASGRKVERKAIYRHLGRPMS